MSKKRSQSRHLAVQAIYQWQVAGQNVKDIRNQFVAVQQANSFELTYFEALLHGVPAHLNQLDELLGPYLDRSIESVDPVERAILRLGAFELQYQLDVPYKVIINEAIELSKIFGAEQGHKYVNGVLDKLAHQLRKSEIK